MTLTSLATEPKVLPLNKGKTQLLVLDQEPGTGMVRGAYWRHRGHNEHITYAAPQQPFDRMKELGAIPAGGKREAWVREAVARDTLEDVLFVLFRKDSPHDDRTLAAYVRATPWGAELP